MSAPTDQTGPNDTETPLVRQRNITARIRDTHPCQYGNALSQHEHLYQSKLAITQRGASICQQDETLPQATTTIRLSLQAVPGPRIAVRVLVDGRAITSGERGHDCVLAALRAPDGPPHQPGPETLSYNEIVHTALRALDGRQRSLRHIPTPIVSRTLRLLETIRKDRAFATGTRPSWCRP